MGSIRSMLRTVEKYRTLRWILILLACFLFVLAIGELWTGAVLINQDYLHLVPTNSTVTAAGGNYSAVIHSLITASEATIIGCCLFWIGFAHSRQPRSLISPAPTANGTGTLDNPYAAPGS